MNSASLQIGIIALVGRFQDFPIFEVVDNTNDFAAVGFSLTPLTPACFN